MPRLPRPWPGPSSAGSTPMTRTCRKSGARWRGDDKRLGRRRMAGKSPLDKRRPPQRTSRPPCETHLDCGSAGRSWPRHFNDCEKQASSTVDHSCHPGLSEAQSRDPRASRGALLGSGSRICAGAHSGMTAAINAAPAPSPSAGLPCVARTRPWRSARCRFSPAAGLASPAPGAPSRGRGSAG
jgi:hypothetical protein